MKQILRLIEDEFSLSLQLQPAPTDDLSRFLFHIYLLRIIKFFENGKENEPE